MKIQHKTVHEIKTTELKLTIAFVLRSTAFARVSQSIWHFNRINIRRFPNNQFDTVFEAYAILIERKILMGYELKSCGRTGNFWEIGASKPRTYENTMTDVTQIFRCCKTVIVESCEVDIVPTICLQFTSFYLVHRFLVMYYDLRLIVTNDI